MIHNPTIWKQELKEEKARFEEFLENWIETDSDRYHLRLEKFFFVGSFICRKLFENNHLSASLKKKPYTCGRYNRLETGLSLKRLGAPLNLNAFYDFESKTRHITLTLDQICNLFIHSSFLLVSTDLGLNSKLKPLLNSVLVTTAERQDSFLFEVPTTLMIEMINNVISDE